MNLPLDYIGGGILLHVVDLWLKWSVVLGVLGTLSGVVSGLTTAEARIVALAIVAHRAGHDILDLCSSLVDVLLPIGFVLHLSLLPCMSLLNWLHILLGLEFALVVISSWLVVVQELVFPLGDEGLVHQSQEVREIKHTESAPEMLM